MTSETLIYIVDKDWAKFYRGNAVRRLLVERVSLQ